MASSNGERSRALGLTWLCACVVAAAGYACSDDTATGGSGGTGACPQGVICGDGGSGAGQTTGGTGPGSGGGGGTPSTGGQGGGPTCIEAWSCTPWESNPPGSDSGVRTCTDANACGTTDNKPVEAATLPALDIEYYKCEVEPVFDKTCSMLGCHGKDSRGLRVYSRGRFRNVVESVVNPCPSGGMTPLANCIGSIECACWMAPHTATEWQRNFDAARGMALDQQGNLLTDMDDSELIQQPAVEGGKAHAGIKTFNIGDNDHSAIKTWLDGAVQGGDGICNTNN
ncbi:MAG: hypothetical protein U0271_19060 [Polyangiaceae bacterium]